MDKKADTLAAKKPLYIGVFLVGESKCGSTTVSDWLFQHPQITPLRKDPAAQTLLSNQGRYKERTVFKGHRYDEKEPQVMMSRIEGAAINWDNGRATSPTIIRQGKRLKFNKQLARCLPDTPQARPDNWKSLAADCSVGYFDTAGAAEAIKALYPDARILITLRHPAAWIYSCHYLRLQLKRNKGRGLAIDCSFEKKMKNDKEKVMVGVKNYLCANFARFLKLFTCSVEYNLRQKSVAADRIRPNRYAANLERWMRVFGQEQLKVIILEEWCKRPRKTAQECYRFIGVDDSFAPQKHRLNPSAKKRHHMPVNGLAEQYNRLIHWRTKPVERRYSENVKKTKLSLMRFYKKFGLLRRPTMPDGLRQRLDDHFKPQVEAVEKLLGRSIPSWHRDS